MTSITEYKQLHMIHYEDAASLLLHIIQSPSVKALKSTVLLAIDEQPISNYELFKRYLKYYLNDNKNNDIAYANYSHLDMENMNLRDILISNTLSKKILWKYVRQMFGLPIGRENEGVKSLPLHSIYDNSWTRKLLINYELKYPSVYFTAENRNE